MYPWFKGVMAPNSDFLLVFYFLLNDSLLRINVRSFKLFSCCYFNKGFGVAIISANDTMNFTNLHHLNKSV